MFLQPAVPAAAAGASKTQPSPWASKANAVCEGKELCLWHPAAIQKGQRTIMVVNKVWERAKTCSSSKSNSSNLSSPTHIHIECKVFSTPQRWEADSRERPEELQGPPGALQKCIACCDYHRSRVNRKGKTGKMRGDMEVSQTVLLHDDRGTHCQKWEARCMYISGYFCCPRLWDLLLSKIKMIHMG